MIYSDLYLGPPSNWNENNDLIFSVQKMRPIERDSDELTLSKNRTLVYQKNKTNCIPLISNKGKSERTMWPPSARFVNSFKRRWFTTLHNWNGHNTAGVDQMNLNKVKEEKKKLINSYVTSSLCPKKEMKIGRQVLFSEANCSGYDVVRNEWIDGLFAA